LHKCFVARALACANIDRTNPPQAKACGYECGEIIMYFTPEEKKILLDLVAQSISYGLNNRRIMMININDYPENLRQKTATFVTLKINRQLRGCIGTLEAYQPLVLDVIYNAYQAAFGDPRFLPLTKEEFSWLQKSISILSLPEKVNFTSENDLLTKIRPGIDGLILSDHGQRGTFLPSVWEELKDPKMFLAHLKMKAGFSPDYWSDTISIERYTTEII
jgi:uncharacterized protein